MKAVVTTETNGKVEVRDIDVPQMGPTDVLVKVIAAASNPADWKRVSSSPLAGKVVGCDFAGTVEKIGSEVPPGLHYIGKRVSGLLRSAVSENGAFAEYVVAPAGLLLPVPDSWSFEEAAQLGVAGYAACLCLFHGLSLPTPLSPAKEPIDVLVWGGSSSVGQLTIQLAKLSGLRVLATSSPSNFSLLSSLGADIVFSYADPETPDKTRSATGGKLKYAVDCISAKDTPEKVAESIGDEGGTVSSLLPYADQRLDVEVKFMLAYHLFGKDIETPWRMRLDVGQYEFGPHATKILSQVLIDGSLKPGPIKIMPHGLAGVNEGLQYIGQGKVSGEKLVYRIADTPA